MSYRIVGRAGWISWLGTVTVLMLTLTAAGQASGPTRILKIVALPQSGTETVVRITADASFRAQDYSHSMVSGGAPRALLKLHGIERPFHPNRIDVGDGNLLRIRSGFHPEHTPPSLHVVFDLASASVTISKVEHDGDTLLVSLQGPGGAVVPSTPIPRPTRAPTATPRPRPTATPRPRPTPRPTMLPPTPTPTAQVRITPIPTATPSPRPQPADSRPPVFATLPAPVPDTAPAAVTTTQVLYKAPPQYIQEPVPGDRTRVASIITEIVTSQREDGSTLLRLSADAPFAHRLFRHEPPAGDPPQHRLYLPGISIPELPNKVLRVEGPNLVGVELVSEPDQEQPESQVILHLDSPDVSITRLASKASHLVIQLGRQAAWPTSQTPAAGTAQAQVVPEPEAPPRTEVQAAGAQAEVAEVPITEPAQAATAIDDIEVVRQSDGATVVRLIANGPISDDRYRSFTISTDPPRHGLSIDGVSMPSAPEVIPVGGPCLNQIRVVQPRTGEPLALHLILDLAAGEVEVAYATHIDNLVLLRLLPPPSPSTSAPVQRDRAALAAIEPAEIADTIVEVTFWRRSDGATVLLVTANGPIPEQSFVHEPTRGTPPVAILRIGGITNPYYPEQIPVSDANIRQIRVGHFGDELILAIEVTSPSVGISQVVHQESKLLVHVEP